MARFHVGFQQHAFFIRFKLAQFGNPLGGLPILHLRIVNPAVTSIAG